FPFAREVISHAVQEGGFPPLMLDPIDFHALYVQRAAQGGEALAGEPSELGQA
ncbi:MAG: protein-export chaperone SecB, partial [Alphaproteobacteria bacterium]|nr:protein-export chaperone SecB [Alphaproteobacteria bacterium]